MWFAMLLAVVPLPMSCPEVVAELRMNPPAYGDQGRAVYAWEKFLHECEGKMGGPGATFSPVEVDAISKVMNPPPR